MKTKTGNWNRPGAEADRFDLERLASLIRRWRQKLGYCSIVATVPAMLVSDVLKARADEPKEPEVSVAGHTPRRLEPQSKYSNIELLKRQSLFRLPHPRNSPMVPAPVGNDECPGRPIPGGTYTVSSPYIDTGDTTGADNTVSRAYFIDYIYYNYDAFGADNVYSFTLTSRGQHAQINVSTTSSTYRPLVYILQDGAAGQCPASTGNRAYNMRLISNSRPLGNTVTLDTDLLSVLPLNVPLYLFIDSSYADANGAGPYTLKMQDVTIAPGCSLANPIDCTDMFVRQQYLDFLGREPDPSGYAGWQNILNNCGNSVATPCDRIEVASAFFRSPEFQGRGYFIYRFYSAVGRIPTYEEFTPAFNSVRGFLNDQDLENAKAAFVSDFVASPAFQNKYSATFGSPEAYVDALLQTVGLPNHPLRQNWIDYLNGNNSGTARAQVLRALVESNEVYQKYYNEAFVIMQYFGYLHRTADAQYLQWIDIMNQNGGDYRVMINGFLNSAEYRHRFGP